MRRAVMSASLIPLCRPAEPCRERRAGIAARRVELLLAEKQALRKIRARQVGAAQVSSGHVGPAQVGAPEVSADQERAAQARTGESRGPQVLRCQIGAAQVGPAVAGAFAYVLADPEQDLIDLPVVCIHVKRDQIFWPAAGQALRC